LDGFNATVIGHGSNPTKTESLYGSDLSNRNDPNFRKGFVYEILRDLFQQTQENSEDVATVLSISLWTLKGSHVIEYEIHPFPSSELMTSLACVPAPYRAPPLLMKMEIHERRRIG
jgi:hypothetical protein